MMRYTPPSTTIPITTPKMTSHTSTACSTGGVRVGTIPTNSRVESSKLNALLIRPRLNLRSSKCKGRRSEIKAGDYEFQISEFQKAFFFFFSNSYGRELTVSRPPQQPLVYIWREFLGPQPKCRRKFWESPYMSGHFQLCESRGNKHQNNTEGKKQIAVTFVKVSAYVKVVVSFLRL